MQNRLLILTLLLILLYFLGGTVAVIDSLSKVFVLASLQLITHLAESPKRSERNAPRRLKR